MWQVLFVFVLVALALTGCSSNDKNLLGHQGMSALRPSGEVAQKELNLIMLSIYIMSAVLVVVLVVYIFVLIRYRKRKGIDRMPEQVHGNTALEVIWTIIPIVLLALIAVPTITTTFSLAEPSKASGDTIEVKVIGHQYWWEFQYPQLGIRTAQELHIPVGKKVHIEIDGKDVLHSFWVPALGGKTDVIPGRPNYMWLEADHAGVYQGKCAELCGASHALMDFKVIADNNFDGWVAQMQQPAPVTTSAQQDGEKLFEQNCMSCHAGTNPYVQGPDLTKFGTRTTIAGILPHDEAHLKEWLKDPQAVKPGALMPKIDYLSPQETDELVQYLMSRK